MKLVFQMNHISSGCLTDPLSARFRVQSFSFVTVVTVVLVQNSHSELASTFQVNYDCSQFSFHGFVHVTPDSIPSRTFLRVGPISQLTILSPSQTMFSVHSTQWCTRPSSSFPFCSSADVGACSSFFVTLCRMNI